MISKETLASIVLVISILCLRGTFIAEIGFNAVIPVVLFPVVLLIRNKISKGSLGTSLFILGVAIVYLLSTIITLFRAPHLDMIVVKNHLTFLVPLIFISFIILDRPIVNKAFKTIININIALICSFFVTVVLYFVTGQVIKFVSIYYDYYIPANVYFPFTVIYGSVYKASGIFFPRLLGIYRESGIGQIMLYFCYIQVDKLFVKNNGKIKLALIFGTIFSLSTAGLITLVFMIFHFVMERKKWLLSTSQGIILFVFGSIGVVTFYFLPEVGLRDKMQSVSYDYRFGAQDRAMEQIKEKPILGSGYRNNMNLRIPPTNYVVSIYQLGIPLWLILGLLYLIPFFLSKDKLLKKLTEFSPLYLSLMFAQPLYFQPLFVLYFADLFFPYKNLKRVDSEKND